MAAEARLCRLVLEEDSRAKGHVNVGVTDGPALDAELGPILYSSPRRKAWRLTLDLRRAIRESAGETAGAVSWLISGAPDLG